MQPPGVEVNVRCRALASQPGVTCALCGLMLAGTGALLERCEMGRLRGGGARANRRVIMSWDKLTERARQRMKAAEEIDNPPSDAAEDDRCTVHIGACCFCRVSPPNQQLLLSRAAGLTHPCRAG